MKKLVLMVLFGLSLNASSAQDTKQVLRIKVPVHTKRQFDSINHAMQEHNAQLRLKKRETEFDFMSKNANIKESAPLLLHQYSNELVASEICFVLGTALMVGNMIAGNNNVGMQEPKAGVYLGGVLCITGYVIHLSSLNTLRKYSLKRFK